jgi:heme oxygenase
LPKVIDLGVTVRGLAHEIIRHHTRPLHDALDSRLVLSKIGCRTGYIDYLLINSACVPIEQALEHAGIRRVLPDWESRRRRAALTEDLAAFGVQMPSFFALTINSDIGSLLGWSYVLEGSRLGANVILQTVMRGPEPEIRQATAFLRHGDGAHLWEGFKARLCQINDSPEAITRACICANEAFQRFIEGLPPPSDE